MEGGGGRGRGREGGRRKGRERGGREGGEGREEHTLRVYFTMHIPSRPNITFQALFLWSSLVFAWKDTCAIQHWWAFTFKGTQHATH